MKLIAATGNAHKLAEFETITKDFGFELFPKSAVGLGDYDPEESGETFAENSLAKAKAICEKCGFPSIADDSGIVVDALGGAPGVRSARYAGVHGNDRANNAKLLAELADTPVERRTGRFCAVVTIVWPKDTPESGYPFFASRTDDGYPYIQGTGFVEGHIGFEEVGSNGFGYDSVFIPLGFTETFGILPAETKNAISHRANALLAIRSQLLRA